MSGLDKPRVLWLHTHMLYWNGGNRYVFEVTRRLAAKCELTLCVHQVSHRWGQLLHAWKTPLITFGRPHTGEFLFWTGLPLFLQRYRHQIERQVGRFDLVISSMFPMNCLAATFEDVPRVQLCYEPFAAFYDPIWVSSFSARKRLAYSLMKQMYSKSDIAATRRADRVLTLSQHNAESIRRVYGVESKPVYEGVDIEVFKPTSNTALETRYRGFNLLLHLSDCARYKGAEQLVIAMPEILRRHPRTVLALVSGSSGKAVQHVMRRAEELGVSHAVERSGFVPDADLPAYYTVAKVVVQPSFNEPMSLPAKEGMACGTPAVRGLNADEEIVDGVTGLLVDSAKPSEIAAAINTLLADETLRQKMGAAARAQVLSYFTWEHVAGRIQESIDELIRL